MDDPLLDSDLEKQTLSSDRQDYTKRPQHCMSTTSTDHSAPLFISPTLTCAVTLSLAALAIRIPFDGSSTGKYGVANTANVRVA